MASRAAFPVLVVPALVAVLGASGDCGCAGRTRFSVRTPAIGLGEFDLRAPDDPTVRGATLFPEGLDDARGWGVEPAGGNRVIVAGLRFVLMADGSMVAAPDRLPATPSSVVAVPERMGGGFVFALTTRLWRAPNWLGTAVPFASAPMTIAQVLVGLDRIYVRSPQGALAALDPRSGAPRPLGPLPPSPNIGRIAAFDAWRAVAIADLLGAVFTSDAGSTWRSLSLPIEPTEAVTLPDSMAIGGLDDSRQIVWWQVRPDGVTNRLPSDASPGAPESAPPSDANTHALVPRPLATAIEDGWPLTDGTAIVARDGAVARIRLTDGAVVERVADAFPLRPGRCHALSLARPADPGAFGFACGEPHGRTVIYRWQAPMAQLVELRHFDSPREVLSFSNGALAARGPCAADAHGEPTGGAPGEATAEQAWCVMPPGLPWQPLQVGTQVGSRVGTRLGRPLGPGDRVVVLDGRTVIVRPPVAGDLASARVAVVDGARASERPLTFPPLPTDVARALAQGIWMDGFEERRPGVVGGWIDAAGTIVGIEVTVAGDVRVGEYIRDAGAPVASGRWAFGWTASRRGFETTDGGMTWTKEVPVPEPMASGPAIRERACGPVGCIASGWLRVGWGAARQVPAADPAQSARSTEARNRTETQTPAARPSADGGSANSALDLDCIPWNTPVASATRASSQAPGGAPAPASSRAPIARGPARGGLGAPVPGAVSPLPPFAGQAAPAVPSDALGYTVEAFNGLERALRDVPLARVYAWGPRSDEWDQLGRWQVRWQWPWGGSNDVRSSVPAVSPWPTLDEARRVFSKGVASLWVLAAGDDPDHALLLVRQPTSPGGPGKTDVIVLETDRPPLEAHSRGGEPFADVEGAVRVGGRWYVATSESRGEIRGTVVWALDGASAREVLRLPRAGFEARPALRLARHSGGHAPGLVVDGQPDPVGADAMRWLAVVDVESGAIGTPEPLAPVDLADRAVTLCGGDSVADGWQIDVPYPGAVRLRIGPAADGARGAEAAMHGTVARVRLSRERACVERVFGAVDDSGRLPPASTEPAARAPARPTDAGDRAGTVEVITFSARTRQPLRCVSHGAAR